MIPASHHGHLAKLRANMADPTDAPVAGCLDCPRRFIYRCWSGEKGDQETIDAMLAGLDELAIATGLPVYGLYILKRGGYYPEPDDLEARCQLWRPGDAAPLVDGSRVEALCRMTEHRCSPPQWN
jgi:hypothetical protein